MEKIAYPLVIIAIILMGLIIPVNAEGVNNTFVAGAGGGMPTNNETPINNSHDLESSTFEKTTETVSETFEIMMPLLKVLLIVVAGHVILVTLQYFGMLPRFGESNDTSSRRSEEPERVNNQGLRVVENPDPYEQVQEHPKEDSPVKEVLESRFVQVSRNIKNKGDDDNAR